MKKASGKPRSHNSLTESGVSKIKTLGNKSIEKKLNDHKLIEKSSSNGEELHLGKKRKHNETLDTKTKILKTDVTNIKDLSEPQHKKSKKPRKRHSMDKITRNPEEKMKSQVKFEKKLANQKKLKEILHIKDQKLRKDKKQKWHKNQNIKQPGIMKKSGNKVKDRKTKPRHRALKNSKL